RGAKISVTGNTGIDALLIVAGMLDVDADRRSEIEARFRWLDPARRLVLVTGHRRENFGEGFQRICDGLSALASRGDVQIVYPVHLNPNVRETVQARLASRENISLIDPVDYLEMVYLMRRAYLIITDSGGIQEEAPALGKPVLVMRET